MREPLLVARPVRRMTVRDQVAAELQRLVLSGAVPVGEALPSEAELCRMFGCSRGAVREALRALEQAGLVSRAPNGRELLVQPVSLDKVSAAMQLYMHLSAVTFDELFEFFEGVEPWTARRAALRRSADQIATLRELADKPLADMDTFVQIEEAFHDRVAESAGNRLLIAARRPLRDALHDALTEIAPRLDSDAFTASARAHQQVVDAIASGDANAAAEWMLRHAQSFRRGLALLRRPASDPVRPLLHLARPDA